MATSKKKTKKSSVKKAQRKQTSTPSPKAIQELSEASWWTEPDGRGKRIHKMELGAVTVAKIRYLKAGEAEGGLGAIMRAMGRSAGAKSPELSPAGWYAQGTWERRGYWDKAGPFKTASEAKKAVLVHFALGAYLNS